MNRVLAFACAVAAALTVVPPATPAVSVSVDRTEVSTALGRNFSFVSRIVNDGSAATRPLVAHLNVLSLRQGVYVDPEDWSSHRTRYIGAIPAGGSKTISWSVKAVNSGDIAVFVAVLPQGGPAEPPVTGKTIHVSIATRRTLNSGGILPLAAGIPAFLALLAFGVRFGRRRR